MAVIKLNPVERIEDEYTGSYEGSSAIIEGFLSKFDTLAEGQRNTILNVLQAENIDTVAKLQAYIQRVGPDIVPRPESIKKITLTRKTRRPVAGKVTSENVCDLVAQLPKGCMATRMLNVLSPSDQAKAFKRAGIRVTGQIDLGNPKFLEVLKNAATTVCTGISQNKGRKGYEIQTPIGSGRNR